MRMVGIEQNSPLWVVSRVGCVTASRAGDVCMKQKSRKDYLAARKAYRMEKLIESLFGRARNHPPNEWMIWGLDTQPLAKTFYELKNDVFVEDGGFWQHDRIRKFRGSPDYLVGKDGLLEIKCPFFEDNHLEIYMKPEVPEKYLWQIRAQLAITGRQWCDFVSFDPRQPEEHLKLVQIRVTREQEREMIQAVECEVEYFIEEIAQTMKFLGAKSRAPVDQVESYQTKQKAVAV